MLGDDSGSCSEVSIARGLEVSFVSQVNGAGRAAEVSSASIVEAVVVIELLFDEPE